MERQFKRIAIVNRGEPAMRLIHAVHELNREQGLGLETVVLYTDVDRTAVFAREADDAVCIGPAAFADDRGRLRSGYLDGARLERALLESRAEAAWAGWGVVADHPELAELCGRLGVVFIGPGPAVMRRLGDKTGAERLAEAAGVPVAPWSGGPAGGAPAATRARHIGVQVIADHYGTVWAAGVRECSVRRRHRRVLEESASAALTPGQDREVREAAVRLCQAAGYRGAGTVELLYDLERRTFSFVELSPGLDAWHPVTEVTTGLDLVKLQLHVARGGRLADGPPAPLGHAVEVRLSAEDPDNHFAPAPGVLDLLRIATGSGLRTGTGLVEGEVVPAELDPVIATLTAWGRDRGEALARLGRALAESAVVVRGGASDKAFLLELLEHPDLRAGTVEVGWLDRLTAAGRRAGGRHADVALVQAAVEAYDAELAAEQARFHAGAARGRPEVREDVGLATDFRHHGNAYRVTVGRVGPRAYQVRVDGHCADVEVERSGRFERWLSYRGGRWRVLSVLSGPDHLVEVEGVPHRISRDGDGLVPAPAPAVVVSVAVRPGDLVAAGDKLAVLEAMKMETTVTAPFGGRVKSVLASGNVQVDAGAPLLRIEAADDREPAAERIRFGEQAAPAAATPPGATPPAAPPAAAAPDGPLAGARRAVEGMHRQVLGFDIGPADAARLLDDYAAAVKELDPGERSLLRAEDEVLATFADVCSLFRPEPDPAEVEGEQVRSAERDLHAYLRFPERAAERLPAAFLDQLRRALRHYGTTPLDSGAVPAESLLLIYKAHRRVEWQLPAVAAILERRLRHRDVLGVAADPALRAVLDRLVTATRRRHQTVSDLASQVRYRYFEQPLLERARERVYQEVLDHLAKLDARPDARPDGPERERRMAALVACPQPLQHLLTSRFPQAGPSMRATMLEVLTRRFYRIRRLARVRSTVVDGHALVTAEYDHQGTRVHAVSAFAEHEIGRAHV